MPSSITMLSSVRKSASISRKTVQTGADAKTAFVSESRKMCESSTA